MDKNRTSKFSLMADATPDVSDKDQLSVVIRYDINQQPVDQLLSSYIL